MHQAWFIRVELASVCALGLFANCPSCHCAVLKHWDIQYCRNTTLVLSFLSSPQIQQKPQRAAERVEYLWWMTDVTPFLNFNPNSPGATLIELTFAFRLPHARPLPSHSIWHPTVLSAISCINFTAEVVQMVALSWASLNADQLLAGNVLLHCRCPFSESRIRQNAEFCL